MEDCLFCRMVAGAIKPDIVYEDEDLIAFRDINPQAPVHILIVPRRHIATANELASDDTVLAGRLILVAGEIAKAEGVDESGYRLVMNCNEGAGQSVFHLHLHLLAGRRLGWPPG
ncbi:MAG TPA: histidine triad nucleotide-binding protein [Gammaproteobacteria bacterium]|nr:histidine triad nucleotide-binding protein [Gammaproteobacteria bacterium]